jgi:hypothetical protein
MRALGFGDAINPCEQPGERMSGLVEHRWHPRILACPAAELQLNPRPSSPQPTPK